MIMFESIMTLKRRLKNSEQIELVHADYIWTASFSWSEPFKEEISKEILIGIEYQKLPLDYILFCQQISNGAILFYDTKNGQWGYEIYGIDKIAEKQSLWKKSIPKTQEDQFIVFGELFGEANVLVFDRSKPLNDKDSFAILEANAIDPIDYWPIVSRSFHEWLDHLITAQGDKYWLWR
jgi:hypothetical protein